MSLQTFVAVAGIPPEIGNKFVSRFGKTLPVVSWLPLDRSECYTESYSKKLYAKFASELEAHTSSNCQDLLMNTNLLLLYLDKNDGSESVILDRFGIEALIAPMKYPEIVDVLLDTKNQKGKVVNDLIREGKLAVKHARGLLHVVAEEVTNRDNKTCLLLPPRNFGKGFQKISDCVRNASLAREDISEFEERLRCVSRSLQTERERQDPREYFVGKRRLVFRSPSKAGARHGLAPLWGDPGHDLSCVIRGRLRFGVSYDPKFHYDCDIPRNSSRRFPSCHGYKDVSRDRKHVNIAPNDNIR